MPTSYNVKIRRTDTYIGKTVTTYRVRWAVEGQDRREGFRTAAAAESFRSKLLTAQREGQAFDVDTGLPLSMVRQQAARTSWYEFACTYIDMKWPAISPKHRKGIAESLITATPAMLDTDMSPTKAKALRSALLNWGFTSRRDSPDQPDDVTALLAWVARHSLPVSDFAKPEVTRAALDLIGLKLDGTRAAGRTASVKRANLSTALSYAVERGLLQTNPVQAIKWKAPKSTQVVDRRAVVNPTQARALLATVRVTPRSGGRLVAFFATIYYSALRPEEAANLRRTNLNLPDAGWGWLTLEKAAPETDKHWTDTGRRREERELKHRAVRDTRRVPCPPPLTAILHEHLSRYGTDSDGRLFRGERGEPLAGVTYSRLWDRARRATFSAQQYESPLAKRAYDLRHACVSTWLNGGVPPTQVAEWAGHSVDVLLKIYAKCLDGQESIALRRIDQALQEEPPLEGTPPPRPSSTWLSR